MKDYREKPYCVEVPVEQLEFGRVYSGFIECLGWNKAHTTTWRDQEFVRLGDGLYRRDPPVDPKRRSVFYPNSSDETVLLPQHAPGLEISSDEFDKDPAAAVRLAIQNGSLLVREMDGKTERMFISFPREGGPC